MLFYGMLALSAIAAAAICILSGAAGLTWLWLLPVSFVGSFAALLLLAFLALWTLCATVDTSKPQEHDSPFFRKLTILLARSVIPLLRMRMHVTGLEKMPQGDGRFLLVCNHLFDLDPVVLMAYFGQYQVAFISKWENSSMIIIGKLMHRLMCQMINRENDREALKTILKCIQLIKTDECSIAVFPEGYCSRDGRLQKMRAGAFKIATKTNVPIVVCTIRNTDKVVRNILRLRPTDIYLDLVEVIPAEDVKGSTAVAISDHVFHAMLTDMGPEYTPVWLESGKAAESE